jgi:hypothetical protein
VPEPDRGVRQLAGNFPATTFVLRGFFRSVAQRRANEKRQDNRNAFRK